MRKAWKQLAALGLGAVMMVTMVPGDVEGAKKSLDLSASSVKINVGKSKKVTIKNKTGKKVKKVTCKVTKGKKNVSVKATKKYVKVKALKAGTAMIKVTVKTAKKTYNKMLKVTVKKAASKKQDAEKTTENKTDTEKKTDTENTTEKKTDTGNATETEQKETEKKEEPVNYGTEPVETGVKESDDGKIITSIVRTPVADGTRQLYGKMYRPADESDGPFPAVILSHGYNGTADDWVDDCNYYAKNGYLCYSIDLCGGSTRCRSKGLKSSEMTIFTEAEDVVAAFDMVYNRPDVDKNRVFLFGGSQGGMVSAMAAEQRADKVRAMALYFPALVIPDQWRNAINDPARFKDKDVLNFMGLNLGRVFSESLQDYYTEKELGKNYENPVYILHGSADAMIPVSSSERAVNEYYGTDQAKLKVLPGECHGFYPAGRQTGMKEVLKFMEEND